MYAEIMLRERPCRDMHCGVCKISCCVVGTKKKKSNVAVIWYKVY